MIARVKAFFIWPETLVFPLASTPMREGFPGDLQSMNVHLSGEHPSYRRAPPPNPSGKKAVLSRIGALDSPIDAMLYSVDSMTTRGASGLMLQRHWQMMGALEATDGMLLFGISTAYMFGVMQAYWPMLMTHRH
jgi:hypothetical protein